MFVMISCIITIRCGYNLLETCEMYFEWNYDLFWLCFC